MKHFCTSLSILVAFLICSCSEEPISNLCDQQDGTSGGRYFLLIENDTTYYYTTNLQSACDLVDEGGACFPRLKSVMDDSSGYVIVLDFFELPGCGVTSYQIENLVDACNDGSQNMPVFVTIGSPDVLGFFDCFSGTVSFEVGTDTIRTNLTNLSCLALVNGDTVSISGRSYCLR